MFCRLRKGIGFRNRRRVRGYFFLGCSLIVVLEYRVFRFWRDFFRAGWNMMSWLNYCWFFEEIRWGFFVRFFFYRGFFNFLKGIFNFLKFYVML